MSVVFKNKGIINMHGITTFGVCVKDTDDPIGYFGTGLKYALAVLMREGFKVTAYGGLDGREFTLRDEDIRDKTFAIVCLGGKPLPFTTDLGKNWQLWHAFRELYANTLDEAGTIDQKSEPEQGYTTFIVEGDAFDKLYEERDQIFLQTEPTHKFDGLEIHDSLEAGGWIYYKGIRVYKLPKRAMYNYNLTGDIRLTEDRTVSSLSDVHLGIAKAITKCDNIALIRQMLLADSRYFESTIDYHWWVVKPGETFNKIVEQFIGSRTSINTSARNLYKRDHPKDAIPPTVQMETIPIEQRRKLWAALLFWKRLGMPIPKGIVHVTTGLKTRKGKTIAGHIYLSKFVLEMDMRVVTGLIYKLYAETKPTIEQVKQEDLLIDTIVDFGERILGVSTQKEVAGAV